MKSESEVTQSCPTLSNPTDCNLPGSSIHGIFQARVLEWGAIAFSALSLNKTIYLISLTPWWLHGKNLLSNVGDMGSILVLGTSHMLVREGNGTLLQYCCLENAMDGGGW